MTRSALAFGLLTSLPLFAQSFEASLFAGRQAYNDFRRDVLPGIALETDTQSKTILSLRFGYSPAEFGPASLQFLVGYQPETTTRTDLKLGGVPLGYGDFKQSAFSIGLGLNFKALLATGIGLDYRSEKLSDGATDTTYGRPWARAHLGYVFSLPQVKPFLAFEIAYPLATTNNDAASPEAVLKSLAPKWQMGLYGGVRF